MIDACVNAFINPLTDNFNNPIYTQNTGVVQVFGGGEGDINESLNRQGNRTAERTYEVEWDRRWDFCYWMVGRQKIQDGQLIITPPREYPDGKGMWATTCQITSFGKPINPRKATEEIAFTKAKIRVTYESLPYDPNNAWKVVTCRSAGYFKTFKGYGWLFESGQEVPADIGVWIPRMDIEVAYNRAPYVPPSFVFDQGKVNNANYDKLFGGIVFPPEYLRYENSLLTEATLESGEKTYSMSYNIVCDTSNHNKEWNPYTRQFEYIYKAPGVKKFEAMDYLTLFPQL